MQRILLIMIALLAWLPLAAAAEPEMIVEVDRTRLYEGESLNYSVTLNHVEKPVEPDMQPLEKDFDVKTLAPQSLNSRSVTIINGQMSEVVRYGRQYNYRLTPRRTGTITIPAPTVKIGGRQLRGREVTLTVLAPDEQDLVRMKITADRASVYPMQPFSVTLSIAVKALPSPYESKSPVGVQSAPPTLKIPWAIDEQLPHGLAPKVAWRQWLGTMENSRGEGFNVNDLKHESVFSLFNEERLAFLPPAEKVRPADKSGTEADYWQYVFRRTFTASKIGDYTFGPAILKGTFAAAVEDGRPVGEDVFAVAKPLTVTVKDVPTDGRPACYIGAVGRFTLAAALAPRKVKTGDPMTLTLTLSGEGAWDEISPPALGKIPAIADHFKIYDATEEKKGDSREFTYSLRPLDAGATEFPAVPVAYFDVENGRYVTIHSEPIPIEVTKAVRLAGRDIVAAPWGGNGNHGELEASQSGIFANITDPAQLTDQAVRPRRWLIALAALAAAYGLISLAVGRWRRFGGDAALLRRRGAYAAARRVPSEGDRRARRRPNRRRGRPGARRTARTGGRRARSARRQSDPCRGRPPARNAGRGRRTGGPLAILAGHLRGSPLRRGRRRLGRARRRREKPLGASGLGTEKTQNRVTP